MAQRMSFTISKDQKAGECKFDIVANPDGFELVEKIRGSNFIDEPFIVRMGYPHLPEPVIEQQFNFASSRSNDRSRPGVVAHRRFKRQRRLVR